jgi:hypothetical protein
MRDLAKRMQGNPLALELIARARDLDDVIAENADAPRVVAVWARARKLWCEITGEELI